MELKIKIANQEENFIDFTSITDDQQRLNALIRINEETERQKALYRSPEEAFAKDLMKKPILTKEAFGYLGFLLGTLPPFTMFSKSLLSIIGSGDFEIFLFFMISMNIICSIVGYYSGRLIGSWIEKIQTYSWTHFLLSLPFLGLLWGILTGGAGGLIVFGFGAIAGAIIAGLVGLVGFPVFSVAHRLLKKGDSIEASHLYPLVFGISLTISAFILGL